MDVTVHHCLLLLFSPEGQSLWGGTEVAVLAWTGWCLPGALLMAVPIGYTQHGGYMFCLPPLTMYQYVGSGQVRSGHQIGQKGLRNYNDGKRQSFIFYCRLPVRKCSYTGVHQSACSRRENRISLDIHDIQE